MSHPNKPCTTYLPALAVVLSLFFISACSLNSSGPDEIDDTTEQVWYSCSASASGKGWDCGNSDLPDISSEENTAITQSLQPATVTVTAISIKELEAEDSVQDSLAASQNSKAVQPEADVVPEAEVETIVSNNLPAAIYTLQLGAFAGEVQREKFIQDEGLPESDFDFRMVENQGRIWWVLTYGEYADTESANQQRRQLEQTYGLSGVWVRPLEDFMDYTELPDAASANREAEIKHQAAASEAAYYDPQYSVQLAAFKTEERRNQYIQRQGLGDEALIFVEEQRDSERWWILLYGEYSSVSEAREAQAYLNKRYGISDTWVKPRY